MAKAFAGVSKSISSAVSNVLSMSISTSGETTLMNEVLATRAHESADIQFRPVLQVITDIYKLAAPKADTIANGPIGEVDSSKEKTAPVNFEGALSTHASLLHKISCEMSCKCAGIANIHATTLSIFKLLSSYSWESIGVLSVAALAANFGELWLVAQLSTTNQLAKAVSFLKQLPSGLMDQANHAKYEVLTTLIFTIISVVEYIILFKELRTQHITLEVPALTEALSKVPNAIYWTVRTAVACGIMITSLVGSTLDQQIPSAAEAPELSVVTNKIKDILSYLKNSYKLCVHYIDEYKKEMESYDKLVQIIESSLDQLTILSALINFSKDTVALLYDGTTKKKVRIDDLKGKNIFFLVSDLDIQMEELEILCDIYEKENTADSSYEIVWFPIVDVSITWDAARLKKYEQLRLKMKWLSIENPLSIKAPVIRYVKEKWHFAKKTILTVLDTKGKVVEHNALHKVQVAGSFQTVFTIDGEIWSEKTWNLQWLVRGIFDEITEWTREKKYVCLYGGEDIRWIKEFIAYTKKTATSAGVAIELVYMGTSTAAEHVDQIIKILPKDQTHTIKNRKSMWLFWTRLESMLRVKVHSGKTVKEDKLMREVLMTLTYDGSGQGWAVIGGGLETDTLIKAKGDLILECFAKFEQWKEKGSQKGMFLQAINEWLSKAHSEKKHCNKLTFPMIDGHVLDIVECPDCGQPMEKYVMYKCCVTK
ncbi:Sieve element occlusion, N-terminal [Dillenia turbinata]|uniref:Sieve element occlusion, N-terminal n=1 Tax=Dillenia turbinata TaxID=194707 RepID=A0AAN8URN4_9MAGN